MQREVIAVAPETEVLDVHRLFVEEEIHGAPVCDDDGIVRGVVSTLDLLRIVREELEPTVVRELEGVTASDAMTAELVTVRPDASIAEVARKMLDQRIHRVLVIEHRMLLGVITTFDLLRALVGPA
jgi:predicted transcriptional regulator